MKKGLKIVLIAAAVAVAVGAGIFFLGKAQPTKEVTVVPVTNVSTSYWGDSQTLDGFVTSGSLQEIHMTEGGFDKIAVKEGDRVRKGDVLVEYDNTQADLTLRGDLAKINLLKSQIAAFEQQISKNYKEIYTLQNILDGKPETKPESGGTATPPSTAVLTALAAALSAAAAVLSALDAAAAA